KFNSAFRARNNQRRGSRAIEKNCKINLTGDLGGFRHEHFVYHAASGPSLMSHQNLPQHFRGNFTNFFGSLANVNSAFESVLERSFAATTGVDLRFNYNIDSSKLTSDLFRFIDCRRNLAMRGLNIE